MVEAQHVVSTSKLVDSLAEQQVLEQVLEDTKPPVPPECQHLDFLLFTPFRYGRYPWNSRFRRIGETPGVFYGSEEPITAAAEVAWGRKNFFEGSPATPMPKEAGQYTAFCVSVDTPIAIDLTAPPMSQHAELWKDPNDYTACLDLADSARQDGAEVIRYESVRHPDGLANVAVLTCQAFSLPTPIDRQTWHFVLRSGRTQVICEHPKSATEFEFGDTRLSFA